MPDELERGRVRPASDDYAFNAYYEDRGKLPPCPSCGNAPDHTPDDDTCVRRRAEAVRAARIARDEVDRAMQRFREAEEDEERRRERRLMVD